MASENGGDRYAFAKQLKHDWQWLQACLKSEGGLCLRRVFVPRSRCTIDVRIECDASAVGLAAILYVNDVLKSYLVVWGWVNWIFNDFWPWAGEDRHPVHSRKAQVEPKHIPALEFLVMLIAMRKWLLAVTAAGAARLGVKSDSVAALGAALRFQPPSKPMHCIAKKLAL